MSLYNFMVSSFLQVCVIYLVSWYHAVMFKLPKIKPLPRPVGVPLFKWEDVQKGRPLGSGTFSDVDLYTTHSGSNVAIKLTKSEFVKKFQKEASILHKLEHCNIIKLLSYSEVSPDAMMLEYISFDFSPFGLDSRASSLNEFLTIVDNTDFEHFEHCQPFIATGILKYAKPFNGLAYLHSNDIVHRDLKPHNILVSNQHYCKSLLDKLSSLWKESPVIVKLRFTWYPKSSWASMPAGKSLIASNQPACLT